MRPERLGYSRYKESNETSYESQDICDLNLKLELVQIVQIQRTLK